MSQHDVYARRMNIELLYMYKKKICGSVKLQNKEIIIKDILYNIQTIQVF